MCAKYPSPNLCVWAWLLSHCRNIALKVKEKAAGISSRWIRNVDLLIESGRTPSAIRTHLMLKANKSKTDKKAAIKSLPTLQQIVSRKSNRRNALRASWKLSSHADLSALFMQHMVKSKTDYERQPRHVSVGGTPGNKWFW